MPRTQNTLTGGKAPSYMMKQGKKSKLQAREAAAASQNATSRGAMSPTPITVMKKGNKMPPPNPMEILAAPQGKMK